MEEGRRRGEEEEKKEQRREEARRKYEHLNLGSCTVNLTPTFWECAMALESEPHSRPAPAPLSLSVICMEIQKGTQFQRLIGAKTGRELQAYRFGLVL